MFLEYLKVFLEFSQAVLTHIVWPCLIFVIVLLVGPSLRSLISSFAWAIKAKGGSARVEGAGFVFHLNSHDNATPLADSWRFEEHLQFRQLLPDLAKEPDQFTKSHRNEIKALIDELLQVTLKLVCGIGGYRFDQVRPDLVICSEQLKLVTKDGGIPVAGVIESKDLTTIFHFDFIEGEANASTSKVGFLIQTLKLLAPPDLRWKLVFCAFSDEKVFEQIQPILEQFQHAITNGMLQIIAIDRNQRYGSLGSYNDNSMEVFAKHIPKTFAKLKEFKTTSDDDTRHIDPQANP